jgi:hypothetical protein
VSQKKRNTPGSSLVGAGPFETDLGQRSRSSSTPLAESLAIVQHARDLEMARTGGLSFGGVGAVRRVLVALLETLTPEQRAEVRRRLGE